MDRKETELERGESRDESPRGAEGVGLREPEAPSRFESLLQQASGLYDEGRYESAVHVWTRVLFLERGHPEARRGIELAKRALAERQRSLDAAVADARALFEAGDVETARERTRSVLAVEPRHAEACHLDTEIRGAESRRDLAAAPPETNEPPASSVELSSSEALPRVSRPRARRPASSREAAASGPAKLKMGLFAMAVILVFALGGGFLRANWDVLVGDGAFAAGRSSMPPPGTARELPPVPGLDELHYYNGARLFAEGRYREARVELALVDRSSAVAVDARNLILRIEERLLRGAKDAEAEPRAEGISP